VKEKIVIGITDCSKYPNYEKWILAEAGTEVIKLGYAQNNFDEIKKCDGIVLTGGEDVHPRYYQRPDYLNYCELDNMDEKRDAFEWKVLEYTQQNQLPVLGICRGLQVANVYFGGTLIPDIPSFGKPDHSKIKGIDRYHAVSIEGPGLLKQITGAESGKSFFSDVSDEGMEMENRVRIHRFEVNSAHHQGVDRIGEGLKVNAVSADGIVEGLERQNPEGKSFLLLVQWHPERMTDQESPLVKNIKRSFLDSTRTP
jgi:putative glutamine amidotransferase